MQAERKKLLAFIFDADVTDLPAGYEEMLASYIEAEWQGVDMAAKFPDVQALLQQYPAYRELYEEMKTVLRLERQGLLLEPSIEVEFDLPFALSDSIWQVVERKRRQVTQLFTELRLVMKDGVALFDQLPNPLVMKWVSMPTASRDGEPKKERPLLSLPSMEHDLSLHLMVLPPTQKSEVGLRIEVSQFSSKKPLPRARVTLRDADYRMLESDLTQEQGRVSFTNLRPNRYVIEVKYKGRVLQMPISVSI